MNRSISVAAMTLEDKFSEVLTRSLPLMPSDAQRHVKAMLTKESIAIMVVITKAWAVSHFFGIGEIADVILLVMGGVTIGFSAINVAKDLYEFISITRNARLDTDLNLATKHFAEAVVNGGITVISAILLKKKPSKTFSENPAPTIGRIPYIRKGLSYKPTAKSGNLSVQVKGITEWWGDIVLSNKLPNMKAYEWAYFHERVHQFLTPKFFLFRSIRIRLKANSYANSYILKYMEEALAEGIATCRAHGISFNGIIQCRR